MNLKDILSNYLGVSVGAGVALLLTAIQLLPIKLNPWSWLGRIGKKLLNTIGSYINSNVMQELSVIKEEQSQTKEKLEAHILSDDYRAMDTKRRAILGFNNELCRGIRHTKESFIETLKDIDDYESYCRDNKDYPNTRAECAIENIKLTYKDVLHRGDFLPEGRVSKGDVGYENE